ncbi:hypothetical protein P154DRAFT_573761 [Amniculicola lignicola CBS 123094]|uniref:C2H2-type domain-containing protein n=1 Tax=Amniculicola lignicola CBS 123094 TaxID=1392246 RepID=A0A6A5WML7_9PLEO|nr:hypothetical protein P154DRAFT_573761 [Amniculicola lignicola CBS 123094]
MRLSIGTSKNRLTLESVRSIPFRLASGMLILTYRRLTCSSDKSTTGPYHLHPYKPALGQVVFENTINLPDGSALRVNSCWYPSNPNSSTNQDSKTARRKYSNLSPTRSIQRHWKRISRRLTPSKQASYLNYDQRPHQSQVAELPDNYIHSELDGSLPTCAELPTYNLSQERSMMGNPRVHTTSDYSREHYQCYGYVEPDHSGTRSTYPPIDTQSVFNASPNHPYDRTPQTPSVSPAGHTVTLEAARFPPCPANITEQHGQPIDPPHVFAFDPPISPHYDAVNRQSVASHAISPQATISPVPSFQRHPTSTSYPRTGQLDYSFINEQLMTPISTSQNSVSGSYGNPSPTLMTPTRSIDLYSPSTDGTSSPHEDQYYTTPTGGLPSASEPYPLVNPEPLMPPVSPIFALTTSNDVDYRNMAATHSTNTKQYGRHDSAKYSEFQRHVEEHPFPEHEEPLPQYEPPISGIPSTWEHAAERISRNNMQLDTTFFPSDNRSLGSPDSLDTSSPFSLSEVPLEQFPKHHSLLSIKPLDCDYCGKKFKGLYQKGNRARHIRLKHSGNESKISCRVCDKEYKRADARRKHEWKKHRIPEAKPKKRRGGREEVGFYERYKNS